MRLVNLIQFPPEMDENRVRDGLEKLGQIFMNYQAGRELLSCAYTTQLLHSTVEVCWITMIVILFGLNLCAETPDR